MMTDEEFHKLLETLFQLGMEDGDLGYKYWSGVIQELKEMRKVYISHVNNLENNEKSRD